MYTAVEVQVHTIADHFLPLLSSAGFMRLSVLDRLWGGAPSPSWWPLARRYREGGMLPSTSLH